MVAITIGLLFSNSELHEHICLENVKNLYKSDFKCDDQQQYKYILEAEVVSTPKQFNDKSQFLSDQYEPDKNLSAGKPLRQFFDSLDIKKLLSAG